MALGLNRPLSSNTAHLCVDMQRLFSRDGPWATPWLERVLPVIVEIVAYAPDRTVFTRFIPPERPDQVPGNWRHFYAGWPEVARDKIEPELLALMPALVGFAPPATVIDRAFYSAFAASPLHSHLHSRRVDTLLVTGAETDVCVLATVLAAVDLGYRVVVVKDALCSSSDETHEALLKLYATRYSRQIELIDMDPLLAAWDPGG